MAFTHLSFRSVVRLHLRLSDSLNGTEIFGKCEFLNPGGSVKDRIARQMVLDAEADGRLKSGGTIVEGSPGNTSVGFVVSCREVMKVFQLCCLVVLLSCCFVSFFLCLFLSLNHSNLSPFAGRTQPDGSGARLQVS